ncbi:MULTISPECIES: 3'-5' exonuclease [Bacillus]|uniref:Exonuclease n=1 Tax=Bacillus cereus TaxID=1396 RepID=A0A9X0SPP1_BACCE|nr:MULTISPECIES: 3'-5' exonuclease [Bacillus cereus group]PEZ74977.1 exonuclease [Bacillus anthracis]KXY51422.1 exonuclease [Bacillus cereus]PES55363.1 exonuclease [Bacillus cereus]PFA29761.1 exonuclease [Bacillus thuringiensis]PFF51854.1 exonuclease [Bacillus cereus]
MKHLLIIDLESTCFKQGTEPRNFFSEIIEIGAVVLNTETFEIVEEYQTFVKPVLFPTLSEYCLHLTTIRQDEVNNGKSIKDAMNEIASLYNKYDCVFASWGFYDKKQFKQVCERFGVDYPFGHLHISLKHQHGTWIKQRPMGMERALKRHHLPLEGIHHRGIDDARNISKIASQMIHSGWNHEFMN